MHRRIVGLTSAFALASICVQACTSQTYLGRGFDDDAGPAPPSFTSMDAQTTEASSGGACPSNECPDGRATCPNNPHPCAVDLSSDDDNCGACGVVCQRGSTETRSTMRCASGECQLVCEPDFGDCNGLADDGCEVWLKTDKKNCGACGNVCDVCTNGTCGCPAGETLCPDGACRDLRSDNNNCSACGNVCPPSDEPPFPPEWNAGRGCRNGVCNSPVCDLYFGDCDLDLGQPDGNGCETLTIADDKNCGACGVECAPGEYCAFGQCLCSCGQSCYSAINDDIDNCGSCGYHYCGRLPSRGVLTKRRPGSELSFVSHCVGPFFGVV